MKCEICSKEIEKNAIPTGTGFVHKSCIDGTIRDRQVRDKMQFLHR